MKRSSYIIIAALLVLGSSAAIIRTAVPQWFEPPVSQSETPSSVEETSSSIETSSSEVASSSQIPSSVEPSSEEPVVTPHSLDDYPSYVLATDGVFVEFTNQTFLSQTGWTTYNERTFTAISVTDADVESMEYYSNAARANSVTAGDPPVTTKYLRLGWTSTSMATMKQDLPFLSSYVADGYRYAYLVSHFFNINGFEYHNVWTANSNLGSVGLTKQYVRPDSGEWEEFVPETMYESGVGYQFMFVIFSKNTTVSIDVESISMYS